MLLAGFLPWFVNVAATASHFPPGLYGMFVKSTARNFHILLSLEAPVDKSESVSTVITTKYNLKNNFILSLPNVLLAVTLPRKM